MYNGLLRLRIPRMVTPVGFAVKITFGLVVKYRKDIENLFDVTISKYAS